MTTENAIHQLGPVAPPRPTIVTALKLLEEFKPIETVVDGLPIGRGALALLTAATGHGKTTIASLLEVALCRGLPFAGREVTSGSVLVLAGENPDDYLMHLAATLQDGGLDRYALAKGKPFGTLLVVPGAFRIDYEMDHLIQELQSAREKVVAVIVDTSAAFYGGEDENDNVEMRRHASSLRELTRLPGQPAVIVLCHPTKNATRDNLLPRGGGAFLAEVDANLTLWKDTGSNLVTMHWAGKIRGPSFDSIQFELVPVELEGYVDCRSKPIFSSAARAIAIERAEQIEEKQLDDENRLLLAMLRKPGSIAELCIAGGFTTGPECSPYKSKVVRLLQKQLRDGGLATKTRTGARRLTDKGKKAAEEVR